MNENAGINMGRRQFLGGAISIAAAEFATIDRALAAEGAPPSSPAAVLGPIRQIDAGALNVGYAEIGPADGPPVILLHGWPYDIQSFAEVAPVLAAAGYRADCTALARLTARRDFSPSKRCAMANPPRSPPTSSR